MKAEHPVPVGDRSIFPGLIAQAFLDVNAPSSSSTGPVR